MNPSILEQTQRIRQEATQRFNRPPQQPDGANENIQNPSEITPKLRGLSKEETALLIGGGVLALGLGVVVVANMEDDNEVVVSPPVAKISPLPKPEIIQPEPVALHPEPIIQHHQTPIPHPIHAKIPDDIKEATSVSESQTFKEAFDAARQELGSGHIFEWHGTMYNTFSAKELHSLSDQQKDEWGESYGEYMANNSPSNPLLPTDDNHVAIHTFEHFSWTGVDKNGDGVVDVLIAKGEGHSPIIWADTDNDGKIDTRFDYDVTTGKLMSSEMPPESYNTDIINNLPELNSFQIPEQSQIYDGKYSIHVDGSGQDYKVSISSNDDNTIDIVAIHEAGKDPFLLMDSDGDGHLETLYGYNHNDNHVGSIPLEHPIDAAYNANFENPTDHYSHESDYIHEQELYFNHHDSSEASHDFDMP